MPILKPEERLGSILAERYRLDEILGKGGMGVVFAGTHTWNNRRIAVKVLLPQYVEDEEVLKRFLREAEAVAALDHPNVVEVLDSGEDEEGEAYIVLELLDGEPLNALLERDGRLPVEETLSILVPVIDGLVFAHEHGIVHRDLKPDNIFVSVNARAKRVPKLLDFGVAKLAQSAHSLATVTGSVLGTPQYMSPEQAGSGEEVGAASDVWSMGVVLYRCLSGALPVEGDSMAQMLVKVISGPPIVLRKAAPDVPPEIAKVVDRALSRSLDERYGTMEELLTALTTAALHSGWEVERDGTTRELTLSKRPPPPVEETVEKEEKIEPPVDANGDDGSADEPELPESGSDANEGTDPSATGAPEPRAVDAETAVAVRAPAPSRLPLVLGIVGAVALAAAVGGIVALRGPATVTRTVVSVPPGADVTVDGAAAGQTPVTLSVSEDRSVEVHVELEGHWPEHLYVSVSDPETIEVELRPQDAEPETVTRRIVTTPAGANVLVAGEPRGASPLDLTVTSERSLDVRLELEGHWPEHLYVSVSDPEVIEVALRPR